MKCTLITILIFIVNLANAQVTRQPVPLKHPLQPKVSPHAVILSLQNTKSSTIETQKIFKRLLAGLQYKKIIRINDQKLKDLRMSTKPFPTYLKSNHHRPSILPISKIHFMQAGVWTLNTNNQYDVITTAHELKINPHFIKKLPPIHVWEDVHHIDWTLNHRRLVACTLAGSIVKVPVVWATQAEVNKNRFEFTTKSKGKRILLILTHRLAAVVLRSALKTIH